jgi:hypothetical protein
MSTILPLGEIVFALAFGFLIGCRLRSTTGEGRVRVAYVFGFLGAVLLYGAYDFYWYELGGVALRRTSYWPGLSGAFLLGIIGLILGRELIGRRRQPSGGAH